MRWGCLLRHLTATKFVQNPRRRMRRLIETKRLFGNNLNNQSFKKCGQSAIELRQSTWSPHDSAWIPHDSARSRCTPVELFKSTLEPAPPLPITTISSARKKNSLTLRNRITGMRSYPAEQNCTLQPQKRYLNAWVNPVSADVQRNVPADRRQFPIHTIAPRNWADYPN